MKGVPRLISGVAMAAAAWPAWAKEGQPGTEPLFLIAGGAGSFAAGVLFGIWLCRKYLCKERTAHPDR